MALNGLLCADVPLRNYSLTISSTSSTTLLCCSNTVLCLCRFGGNGRASSDLYIFMLQPPTITGLTLINSRDISRLHSRLPCESTVVIFKTDFGISQDTAVKRFRSDAIFNYFRLL